MRYIYLEIRIIRIQNCFDQVLDPEFQSSSSLKEEALDTSSSLSLETWPPPGAGASGVLE